MLRLFWAKKFPLNPSRLLSIYGWFMLGQKPSSLLLQLLISSHFGFCQWNHKSNHPHITGRASRSCPSPTRAKRLAKQRSLKAPTVVTPPRDARRTARRSCLMAAGCWMITGTNATKTPVVKRTWKPKVVVQPNGSKFLGVQWHDRLMASF